MRRTVLPIFILFLIWIISASFEQAEAQATFHQIQISNDADDGYLNNNDGTGWHHRRHKTAGRIGWVVIVPRQLPG